MSNAQGITPLGQCASGVQPRDGLGAHPLVFHKFHCLVQFHEIFRGNFQFLIRLFFYATLQKRLYLFTSIKAVFGSIIWQKRKLGSLSQKLELRGFCY